MFALDFLKRFDKIPEKEFSPIPFNFLFTHLQLEQSIFFALWNLDLKTKRRFNILLGWSLTLIEGCRKDLLIVAFYLLYFYSYGGVSSEY